MNQRQINPNHQYHFKCFTIHYITLIPHPHPIPPKHVIPNTADYTIRFINQNIIIIR